MKDILIISACIYALSIVFPPAVAGLALIADVPLFIRSAALGVCGGAAFGLLVAYAWIYNSLVEADRKRGHEKVDKDADGRRI